MKLKVFVDTNILLSGIFFEGNEAKILDLVEIELLTGEDVVDELRKSVGSDTKIDISQDDKTHPFILYEPLAQRAIGPLDRGEIITKNYLKGQRAGDCDCGGERVKYL
jgi:hypothetical protein